MAILYEVTYFWYSSSLGNSVADSARCTIEPIGWAPSNNRRPRVVPAISIPTACPVCWLMNADPLINAGLNRSSINTHTAVSLADWTVPCSTRWPSPSSPSPPRQLNSDTRSPGWGLPRGGMGGITQAMASFARAQGVELRTGAAVQRILVEQGKAVGVRLESGEEIRARAVLSNADPKRTFLNLLAPEDLPEDFRFDISHLRMGHASLRMNLALSGLPELRDYPGAGVLPQHQSSIVIFPSMAAMEQNYHEAKAGKLPSEPRLDLVIPSTLDDSLAPPGHHVMSLLCKYYPFTPKDGHWDELREPVADQIIDYLSRFMPNLKELVVGRQVLTPLDLERVFGLTEGDIFHGRHDLDQIFSLRPHPRAAQYKTPLPGLYLCGSGSHPGGAVSGAPGYNGARRVIRDLR